MYLKTYTFIRQRELTIKNKIQWTLLHMNSECIYIPSYEKPAGFQCHFFGFHSCRSKQKNTIRYCIHAHKQMSSQANLINFKRILISISFLIYISFGNKRKGKFVKIETLSLLKNVNLNVNSLSEFAVRYRIWSKKEQIISFVKYYGEFAFNGIYMHSATH